MKNFLKTINDLFCGVGKLIFIIIILAGLLGGIKYFNNHIKKIPIVDKYLNSTCMDKDLAYPLGY